MHVHLLNMCSIPGAAEEMRGSCSRPLGCRSGQTCVCAWLLLVKGGWGQRNQQQTIYYNDRKQEVQPLYSHMAASCLGSKRREDRENDREKESVCVYVSRFEKKRFY